MNGAFLHYFLLPAENSVQCYRKRAFNHGTILDTYLVTHQQRQWHGENSLQTDNEGQGNNIRLATLFLKNCPL